MMFLEDVLYLSFGLVFALMMSVNRYHLTTTLFSGASLLFVLIIGTFFLSKCENSAYFEFFYPVVSTLAGMFYVMVISEYNGLKAIFPFLVGVYFVTVSATIRDVLIGGMGWSFNQALFAEFIFLIIVLAAVEILLKPFYGTTVRYSNDGWINVDLYLLTYFLMFFLMYATIDMEKIIEIRIGIQVIMLIAVISICEFTARAIWEQEREYSRFMLDQQVKAGAMQIEAYRESEKRMSVFRHDMRHWLGLVEQLLATGHYDKARDMVTQLSKNMEQTRTEVFCENIYVNAVFAMQVANAMKRGVEIEVKADIPEHLGFSETEFAVVVSNLLENAVKAAEKVEDIDERKVTVTARNTGWSQIFEITNKYRGDIEVDEKGYPVTREAGHGIGMISVDTFVKETGAILSIDTDNGTFKLVMLINC